MCAQLQQLGMDDSLTAALRALPLQFRGAQPPADPAEELGKAEGLSDDEWVVLGQLLWGCSGEPADAAQPQAEQALQAGEEQAEQGEEEEEERQQQQQQQQQLMLPEADQPQEQPLLQPETDGPWPPSSDEDDEPLAYR
ncbi:hypothetical protein ABPG75_002777 [Micractinium tetrahymenae]